MYACICYGVSISLRVRTDVFMNVSFLLSTRHIILCDDSVVMKRGLPAPYQIDPQQASSSHSSRRGRLPKFCADKNIHRAHAPSRRPRYRPMLAVPNNAMTGGLHQLS